MSTFWSPVGISALFSLLTWAGACVAEPTPSQVRPVVASATSPDHEWQSLTAGQQRTLAPLASQWSALDSNSRDKWLDVARRFPQLSAADQQRIQQRMTQWARLPPQERGQARLRFQNTRQLSPAERQQSWEAYQALTPEARRALAQQARRKQKPVVLPAAEPGPREASQQDTAPSTRKSNLVPNPLHGDRPAEAVAPAVVRAGRGATTSLVTEAARPPLHQQTGLPKINAAEDFVDPQTLLPRRGPQGAGMTPPSP